MIIGADSTGMDGANPFWTYSLSVYEHPDVRRCCLALQDRGGIDVNLLLELSGEPPVGGEQCITGNLQRLRGWYGSDHPAWSTLAELLYTGLDGAGHG